MTRPDNQVESAHLHLDFALQLALGEKRLGNPNAPRIADSVIAAFIITMLLHDRVQVKRSAVRPSGVS
jgi:hypothetical protein